MARSNTGGTRGFLRGKVADDLYQVTKNRYGKRIQLVRSVEEQRQNNNTEKQALARMQMALLMGCLKQFKEIVDHSWETIPYGQLSIAHFVELNMPLIHEDSKNNWESDNVFDYPTKGISLLRVGAFIMAEGSLTLPSCLSFYMVDDAHAKGGLQISTDVSFPQYRNVLDCLGVNANDYITMLLFQYDSNNRANNFFMFSRAYLKNVPEKTADVLDLVSVEVPLYQTDTFISVAGQISASSTVDLYRMPCNEGEVYTLSYMFPMTGGITPLWGYNEVSDSFIQIFPRHYVNSTQNINWLIDEPFEVPVGCSFIYVNRLKSSYYNFSVKKVIANDFFLENRSAIVNHSIVLSKESFLYPSNIEDCFTYDGNCNRFVSFDQSTGKITIANQKKITYMQGELVAYCIVLSKWDGVKWCRNNAQFLPVDPEEPWRDLLSPNDVFQSWFPSYDPDNPHNPWEE